MKCGLIRRGTRSGKYLLVIVLWRVTLWSGVEVLIGQRLILGIGLRPKYWYCVVFDVGEVISLSPQGELGP